MIMDSLIKTPKVVNDIDVNKDDTPTYEEREQTYTDITADFEFNYSKTHNQKRRLKETFFWFIMILYTAIILVSLACIVTSLIIGGKHTDIVIGSVASIITSVISIPIIIANYLFPTGEDRDMTTMISKMQDYDNGLRRLENEKNRMQKDNINVKLDTVKDKQQK